MTADTNEPDTLVVDRSIGLAGIDALHLEICRRLSMGRGLKLDLSQFEQISFCLSQLVVACSKSFIKEKIEFSVLAKDGVIESSMSRAGISFSE